MKKISMFVFFSLVVLVCSCSSNNENLPTTPTNSSSTITIPLNGCVAWYPFNGNANDVSLQGNNGTIYQASLTSDRFGIANKAYLFDGIDDRISVPNSSSLSNFNSFTVSGWFYASTFTSYQGLVSKWYQTVNCSSNTDNYICLLVNNNLTLNVPALVCSTNAYPNLQLKSTNSLQLNTWTHFVFVHNSSFGGTLYINGNLSAIFSNNATICSSTNQLLIGADSNQGSLYRFFNGKLDDIAIWNRALSNSEILQVYNATN